MDALKMISNSSMKENVPEFNVGDTVKVHVQIKEGDKSRIQIFEGTVIAKKHGGINETFTVRRVAHGCGIERVFPLHAPAVDKVEVVRHGKVRRAKLYYLRDRVGKAAKSRKSSKFCDGKEELVKSSFFVFIRKMSIQVSGFTVE